MGGGVVVLKQIRIGEEGSWLRRGQILGPAEGGPGTVNKKELGRVVKRVEGRWMYRTGRMSDEMVG